MSWSKEVTLWCDDCNKIISFGHTTVSRTRRSAEEEGWDTGVDKDLCPECKEGGSE